MEYQEIITAYKNGSLDISGLKKKLQISKPLKGREKYRILETSPKRFELAYNINNLLITPEQPEKQEKFNRDSEEVIESYFLMLVDSIEKTKAWKLIKLNSSENTLEKFRKLNIKEKFQKIYDLNKRYLTFLNYQRIADIRDCLKNSSDLDDETITKLQFIISMFDNFKNESIKSEFVCFKENFLKALVNFRKSKKVRLEDFMNSQSREVQFEYEKFSKVNFFTNEEYRDISENLVLASKTLKTSVSTIIEAYGELSETEAEIKFLKDEIKDLEKLEEKVSRMLIIQQEDKKQQEKNRRDQVESAKRKKKIDELVSEIDKRRLEKAEHERNRVIGREEGSTGKMEEKIETFEKTSTVKEKVIPLIFSWFDKEDLTIARRISSKKLTAFFEKIKQVEKDSATRVSLFIVTNAGKELSLKRLHDFQKKAETNGLPRLVEGIFGGYSSFKIDTDGNITDIATMSQKNRTKIMNLLESSTSIGWSLSKQLVLDDETNYLRYQFSDKRDKSIDKKYLNLYVANLLRNERVKKQPLRFLPFIEGKYSGIDVLLESQLKGISQLSQYYKNKYLITPGNALNASTENIDDFIGKVAEDRDEK